MKLPINILDLHVVAGDSGGIRQLACLCPLMIRRACTTYIRDT